MLQHHRLILLVVVSLTFLCTFSSVRYLSRIIAAQHSASLRVTRDGSGDSQRAWLNFLDRAEANIGSHLPHFLHNEGSIEVYAGNGMLLSTIKLLICKVSLLIKIG
jgi:streptomycin 6-kinase